ALLPRRTLPQFHPLSPSQLDRYFARIGFDGPRPATLGTLRALHRAHLLAIPYENLDIHLGLEVSLDPEAMFAKLVDERRGGWCYEMNGVFGRVLETLGFNVRYLSGAVGRAERGWRAQGNHLVLLVTLDRPWIADVGFGDGFLTPLPLEPGNYRQDFLEYRVTRDGPRWRVHNHQHGGADGFDFTLTPRRLGEFAQQCHELQTLPESGFVKSTVCERMLPTGLVMLRGATLREVRAEGATTEVVESAASFDRVLRERFDLSIPGIETLWPRVWERHLQWQAERLAEARQPRGPGAR
ncbi:MAG TPA: arylamine N-acetyltransferase, partial [Vicinamibacterales bacterium]|nr:arylamine N-acetyltransferase [Vicinamibacterales bacterium]